MPDISIIIPAYNEESRLPRYLDSVLAYFEKDAPYEVIVVDDGSTDATAEVVELYAKRNPNVTLVRLPRNRGKGFAVKTGMLQASGRLRLFADADGATPIQELERLKRAVEGGADVAVASRALYDTYCTVEARFHRKIIGTVFNLIVRTLTVKGISDTQCGFKLFAAEAAAEVFPLQRIDGFGFDVEVLFVAARKGFRIVEVPINWTEIDGTKVRLVRDSIRMLYDVLKIRVNELKGAYGS